MRTVFLSVICCVFVSLVSAQIDAEKSRIRHQIMTVIDSQLSGWNDGSIESYMDGYLRSDSLRFASGSEVTHGWETTLRRYQKNYASKEKMGLLTFSDISIDVLSNDAAVAFGRWSLSRTSDQPHGLFTLIFKQVNGHWRIVHDHTSSGR